MERKYLIGAVLGLTLSAYSLIKQYNIEDHIESVEEGVVSLKQGITEFREPVVDYPQQKKELQTLIEKIYNKEIPLVP